MTAVSAEKCVKQFVSLQGQLVRRILNEYKPEDRESFRDVPNGTLLEEDIMWTHRRHGAGLLFVSSEGVRVNAHVAMAEYPEGIDGGRLFEYLESIEIASVIFEDREYAVTKLEMDELVDHMVKKGLLRPVVSSGRFPHRVFELVRELLPS